MKNDPEQFDSQTSPELDRLLDEALAAENVPGGVPEDLTQRILALTQSNALLDEALAPEAPRPELAASIYDKTVNLLPGRGRGILARIGPRRVGQLRQLAAAIILVMEAGIWASLVGISNDAKALGFIRSDIRTFAQYTPPSARFDVELSQLESSLDHMSRSPWSASVTDPGAVLLEMEQQLISESLNL